MTSTVADFYGVPGQGVLPQTDTITLSHTSPAALSKKGIVSYPALDAAGAAPTADVITVFDVTTSTALVLNTDYTLTASGSSPETLTYSVTRINSSSASADADTATVTYRYGVERLPQSGEFQGYAGAAPTGTQFEATNTDTEGGSAGGLGSAAGYGSLTDPAAGKQSSSETGAPGSEYAVSEQGPGTFGWASGAPDTEGVYGGGTPENFTPVLGANYSQGNLGSSADPNTVLDTTVGGGSDLVSGLGTPPGYRAPSSGVGGSNKDTTLTDILGNQVNATVATPPSGYAAAQIDTLYFGAPDQPTSLAAQTDTFSATAAATHYYLTKQGLDPTSIVVTDTTGSVTLVLSTDYAVTTSGNGPHTVSYIVLTAGTNYTAGDNISVAYNYGNSQYWGSNTPSAVPAAPGTPSVTAVNRGVKCSWSPPGGSSLIPVDYYLLACEDLGTMFVPYTGQPVLDGQPSPSGGADTGQPAYQADTFTNFIAAALAAPSAPSGTGNTGSGSTLAAGNYKVIVTYTNANGESVGSASTTVAVTATDNFVINSPAASGSATGWYAYVTQAGGSTYTRQQTAGSPTAIATNLTLTAPPTSSGAAPPTINTTLPTTSQTGVITPAAQIIVRDTTSTEKDPLQPGGTVLEYGYDYTVTQIGVGPWTQYQIALLAGSQNAAAGDTIIVEYWWGQDPSTVSAVFTQGLVPNIPVIYKPDGSTYGFQGYRFKVAAGNKAGLGPYSAFSSYAVPLNFNEAQPGHEGSTQNELVLDPANTVNPIYTPDGTVKAGTGLGG